MKPYKDNAVVMGNYLSYVRDLDSLYRNKKSNGNLISSFTNFYSPTGHITSIEESFSMEAVENFTNAGQVHNAVNQISENSNNNHTNNRG